MSGFEYFSLLVAIAIIETIIFYETAQLLAKVAVECGA